jgi:NAD(P)-dependent dehydrogenase (short-subunit alcohol dehydrogenase family)
MRIVVTGANRGIGAALVDAYRAIGAQPIGTARHPAPGSGLIPLDVTDAASVRALASAVPGPVDLLICNAGIYPDGGQQLETGYPQQMWAEVFATNVTGVFLTVQAMLPALRAARAGKIAILSSHMGSDERAPGGSYIYRSSKAAALNIGRNLAADLRAEGIAVGIYHPGWVQTEMGGRDAEITPQASAAGLVARFAELSLGNTGAFRNWDGRDLPF